MAVPPFMRSFLGREVVRAALVLLAILHVCFFPCIWGNRTLLESSQDCPSILPSAAWAGSAVDKLTFSKVLDQAAPAWQTEPLFKLIGQEYLVEKKAPLWNPYQGFGVPLAA